MLPSDVLVLRDGSQVKLPASELVNGDLISIGLGEKVPADLRLIQVSGDLRFDRSILTGEVCGANTSPSSFNSYLSFGRSERAHRRPGRHDRQELP